MSKVPFVVDYYSGFIICYKMNILLCFNVPVFNHSWVYYITVIISWIPIGQCFVMAELGGYLPDWLIQGAETNTLLFFDNDNEKIFIAK